ncbi:MAG: putative histidine transporter YuiF (NhaC family) [Polaribacter sp.]|jgi:predicted histidine transporter YuiF (NhaC family)
MNRERPVIEDLIKENMSALELFQNQTLRPVIKMQHTLLIAAFNSYKLKRKIDFSSLTEQKKRSKIKAVFIKDINHKNQTIGIIVGAFSLEEYAYYSLNASELNKRIIQIVIQRTQDSLAEIV